MVSQQMVSCFEIFKLESSPFSPIQVATVDLFSVSLPACSILVYATMQRE